MSRHLEFALKLSRMPCFSHLRGKGCFSIASSQCLTIHQIVNLYGARCRICLHATYVSMLDLDLEFLQEVKDWDDLVLCRQCYSDYLAVSKKCSSHSAAIIQLLICVVKGLAGNTSNKWKRRLNSANNSVDERKQVLERLEKLKVRQWERCHRIVNGFMNTYLALVPSGTKRTIIRELLNKQVLNPLHYTGISIEGLVGEYKRFFYENYDQTFLYILQLEEAGFLYIRWCDRRLQRGLITVTDAVLRKIGKFSRRQDRGFGTWE